jgi:hypothetical protein
MFNDNSATANAIDDFLKPSLILICLSYLYFKNLRIYNCTHIFEEN